MDRESIPDEVQRFVLTSIPSVPFLEAMLLLRNGADQWWDGKKLAQRLYMSEKAAHALLSDLHAAGILLEDTDRQQACLYSYRPASEELRAMIDQLDREYSRNLIEIANLIHSKIGKKAQHFANAFKFRKDA